MKKYLWKSLLFMYAVTAIFLVILAFLLYKLNLNEAMVRIGIIVTYIASCFVGGYFMGCKMKQKKFLWGLLSGALYVMLLFVLSFAVKKGIGMETMTEPIRILTTILLCAVSGMAGGMLS